MDETLAIIKRECNQTIHSRKKNWLFSDTQAGAVSSAAMYYIIYGLADEDVTNLIKKFAYTV